jgi:GAF domain-containing protein/HAMP domain-containing protein
VDSPTALEQRHYTRIHTRLAIAFAVMAAIITITITVILFIQARRNLYTQFEDRVTILLKQAEEREWPDLLANIHAATDEGTPNYDFLQQQQKIFMANDPTISSVYSLRQDQLGTIYYLVGVLSSDLAEKRPPIHFGVFVDSPRQALLDAFKSSSQFSIDKNTRSDDTGTWISAYAPIVNTDGKGVGVFGFDISAKSLVDAERNMLVTSIVLMALALPIFAGIGWVLGSRLARPIVELTNGVNRITSGDLAYRVDIKSGDEIEALADSFNIMTARVDDLVDGLEQRVEERTSNLTSKTNELEEASKRLANRASQLTAVSVVARSVTTMRDVNQLLPNITSIISQQFGYYHVGIFLNDAGNQYAVLRAANSEGGKRMLDQGHRLKIGQVGIVGNVASTGKPRIALDTGEDAVFFNNPNLPSTKSEMALPLKIGEKIIGVIDVQSTESAAFKQEDVEILTILADQVSIAIENARLFEEAQKSSAEAQSALRQYARTDWGRLQRTRKNKGYRYTYKGIESLTKTVTLSDKSFTDHEMSVIKIPLTIREEQIGSLGLLLPANKTISDDEMDIARAIAERVALSIENARLFEDTSSRAEREKTVADISNKIRSTNDPETMIQTALRELQNALGASKIQILPYSTSVSQAPQTTPKKARKSRAKSQD